ncbi:hypothetical protein [Prevotella sp. tc2-28]|uniref:hypothetical protein n=1 Tax=Prevotella sp. tc2-28 TaxID=1761888 RepID=UPI00115FD020|nr:hypothetical protein [Prevotella sp. tc2-28]
MKKSLLTTLFICFVTTMHSQSVITDKGYIYSPDGFAVKTAVATIDGKIYKSTGLYSKDGKVFIQVNGDIENKTFVVLSGAEVIGPEAFDGCVSIYQYPSYIYIPSTVKYISQRAFEGGNYNGGSALKPRVYIYDDSYEDTSATSVKEMSVTSEGGVTEIARYNISGQKLNEPQKGINIVQMSDRTVHKEYVR